MKKITSLLVLALFLGAASFATAQNVARIPTAPVPEAPVDGVYTAQPFFESLNVDVFGTYRHGADGKQGDFGEGIGLTYSIVPTVAFGIDVSKETGLEDDNIVGDLQFAGNLYLKFPEEDRVLGFKPYFVLGGGRGVDQKYWQAHVGGGTEWSLWKGWSFFADTRYSILDDVYTETGNKFLSRAGIRLEF
jgi:hypothetical protein